VGLGNNPNIAGPENGGFGLIEGTIGEIKVGDQYPVRIMAVINLSIESFYRGSVATSDQALSIAEILIEEKADLLDLGAVSTAPGSPKISETTERERLIPVLRSILDRGFEVSVDTQRASIADQALSMGARSINDVSGLRDPAMVRTAADHDASVVVMASKEAPGDLLTMEEILHILDERSSLAASSGVDEGKIIVDPGIGRWTDQKKPEHDLAILDGFRRLRVLGKPVMAALSRKSFIGASLSQPDPANRLSGSLAATAIAVYNGAHIVRTHDVSASLDTIHMAEAIRGGLSWSQDEDIFVEVLGYLGHENDLTAALRVIDVDPGGYRSLCKKGSFRILEVSGISSMEAIIIKQEMLARGGDAAIPKMTLRLDPKPQKILIMGTLTQISGLARKLKEQPFRLPSIGIAIDDALSQIDDPKRYR
jgi:dihydropteroate synthase